MAAVAALRVGRGGGMNASRDRRIARLERAKLEREGRPAANVFYVWRNAPTESAEEAIARRFPDGLPKDAQLVICSWQVAGSPENPISEA
jgi:hypothetical protein